MSLGGPAFAAALVKAGVKPRKVVIDVLKLASGSKAACIKAAEEIEAALNDVPYMELGEGYADHVRENALSDLGTSFEERCTEAAGWRMGELRKEKEAAESRCEALQGLLNVERSQLEASLVDFGKERQLCNDLSDLLERARWEASENDRVLRNEIASLPGQAGCPASGGPSGDRAVKGRSESRLVTSSGAGCRPGTGLDVRRRRTQDLASLRGS